MTKHVNEKIQDGNFSIVEFCERRVRRIVPALFFPLIVASVLGYLALFPYNLSKFSKADGLAGTTAWDAVTVILLAVQSR